MLLYRTNCTVASNCCMIPVLMCVCTCILVLQPPFSHEIQPDTQASSQVRVGYGQPVRPSLGAVSGGYHTGVQQAVTSGASPEHHVQPASQRPVYVATVPSAMPQAQLYGQPAAVSLVSCDVVSRAVSWLILCRGRTIPRKAPNIQYPIILASIDTSTNIDTSV